MRAVAKWGACVHHTVDAGVNNKSDTIDSAVACVFRIDHNSSDVAIIATGVIGILVKTAMHSASLNIPKLPNGFADTSKEKDISIV